MKIKSIITKIIPSYRAKDAIMDELGNLSNSIFQMKCKLDDMDKKNEYLFYCLQHLEGETDLETRRRVFLDMPKSDGEIANFQIVANYILQKVKKICDQYSIQYFLDAGTLLGSVRHHGFIPWDDDVDIGIMRSDYYRLMAIMSNNSELEMRRYYRYTRPGYEAGYVTKIKLRSSDLFYIDVFPCDYMEISADGYDEAWQKSELMCDAYHEELQLIFQRNAFSPNCCYPTSNASIDAEVEKIEKMYIKRFNQQFTGVDQGEKAICYGIDQLKWCRRMRKILPASIYIPIRKNEGIFEGEKYSILQCTEKYLECLYGDFWSLPQAIHQTHATELKNISETDHMLIEKIKRSMSD